MATVHIGRFTAEVTDDLVVFLIGMRVNRVRDVRAWWWVSARMPRMIQRLVEEPDLGLLHAVYAIQPPRGALLVQYWRSVEDLHRFAQSADEPHLAPWREFNKKLAGSGSVGVWHEAYLTGPGRAEAVYSDMPAFGLAQATRHVPVGQVGNRAAQRLARPAAV
jgi:hypothetical protein